MHTFFINTSGKKLEEYNVLWDIQHENKKIVSIDCPFSAWFDEARGYKNCVKQIGNMIDAYAELNNEFNVIIYIDLTSNPVYSDIDDDGLNNREIKACLNVMHKFYSDVVSRSLLAEFAGLLREPASSLVMFGEYTMKEDILSKDPSDKETAEKISTFIGMPDIEELKNIAKNIIDQKEGDLVEIFKKEVTSIWKEGLFPDILSAYNDELSSWYEYVINNKNIDDATEILFEKIMRPRKKNLYTISCPYDKAVGNNNSVEALNNINIMLHVIKCSESDSVFKADGNLKRFYAYNAQELAQLLKQKEKLFCEKIKQIDNFSNSYFQEGLAPELAELDYKKFCLDEFGDRAVDLIIKEEKDSNVEENDVAAARKTNTGSYEDLNKLDKIEISEVELSSLFTKEEYPLFEYGSQIENDRPTLKTKPEEHIEYGKKVKRMHRDFLKKFKLHTSERLSGYAGKSKENKPALLKKGKYKSTNKREERALESVEQISSKAYNTVLERYMEFCAGRTVSVTDISKQCDLFVTRVHQITASLKKKKFVAAVVSVALIAYYIPFFLISRKFIDRNDITTFCFFVSFFVPVIIGIVAYIKAVKEQRRKYFIEHNNLAQESEKIMSENRSVARKYDQLLSSVIPALRWVYEYRLDVENYAECCRTAEVKLNHHKKKLAERVNAIENILSDIECNGELVDPVVGYVGEIDYRVPFCFGERNIEFYAIADVQFFKTNDSEGVDCE